jgi:hypothetical protein
MKICAFYCLQEANNSNDGKAAHFAWRNYDDFNEYFWFVFTLAFLLYLFLLPFTLFYFICSGHVHALS